MILDLIVVEAEAGWANVRWSQRIIERHIIAPQRPIFIDRGAPV